MSSKHFYKQATKQPTHQHGLGCAFGWRQLDKPGREVRATRCRNGDLFCGMLFHLMPKNDFQFRIYDMKY